MVRAPATVVIGAVAALVVAVVSAGVAWRASDATIDAGFWWGDTPFLLSSDDARKIGGPLSESELARIKEMSRVEMQHAYTGLRINIVESRDAFWRVSVVGTPLRIQRNHQIYPFSAAGESRTFGPLGGSGSVAFAILAHNAVAYAPANARREAIVAGMGRGIGRAAVHELAHQVLGPENLGYIDNRTDINSFEYANADRPSQYYGELQWTTAWPVLHDRFGC